MALYQVVATFHDGRTINANTRFEHALYTAEALTLCVKAYERDEATD